MVLHTPSGAWTFTGPPAAGKSTLMASLKRLSPEATYIHRNLTRPPRPSDIGTNVSYITRAQFEEMFTAGVFYERIEVHGNLYGVRKADIDSMALRDDITFVEFTPVGIEYLWKHLPFLNPSRNIRSIFLDLRDEAILRERLEERGDEDIEKRIVDSRPWYEEAKNSFVPYRFIDARQSKDAVLAQALKFLTI